MTDIGRLYATVLLRLSEIEATFREPTLPFLTEMTSASRMVYAFARDGGLPYSRVWAKISKNHQVPANAIWVIIPITALFTIWAQVEVVIIALCTFAMYVTYGMVVGSVLWGKSHRKDQRDSEERKHVSRPLCWAALTWLVLITGLLVFMTALTVSRLAMIETVVGTVLVVLAGFLYYRFQRKNNQAAVLRPASED